MPVRLLVQAIAVALLCIVSSALRLGRLGRRSSFVPSSYHGLKVPNHQLQDKHASQAVGVRYATTVSASTTAVPDAMPMPGSPVIRSMNKESGKAMMAVALTGEQTQKAFSEACDLFNEEVKGRGYKVPGFRPGAKLPPVYLYEIFGEDKLKLFCGQLLGQDIQDEVERTGLMFVGRGKITQFNEKDFAAGKPHFVEVECDLWPDIKYGGSGYKGLSVTVTRPNVDKDKFEQVKNSIRGRYKVLSPMPQEYAAKAGDVCTVNMKGYERKADGSKGAALPAIAAGDNVDVTLEKGKFMDGLIEGLMGSKAGDVKEVPVTFPVRPSGPGAALSGKEALFEMSVLGVKQQEMPEWTEELAARVRDGLTIADMEKEIREAIEGEGQSNSENVRNEALAAALVETIEVSKLPESLMEETTQQRFQTMLMDFKEQGSTQEQLEEMSTPENYEKYKVVSKKNAEKAVKLGMAFRDISEKEKIAVLPAEIQEQWDMIAVQAKQKGEKVPDERRAKDEIENQLLRKKVFDLIAANAKIEWKEADPTAA